MVLIPVTGASMSSIVFSWRSIAAPSLIIRSATASSTRPSLVRWAFRRSTRGFPSQSNTSFNVRRWLRGKGTAEDRGQAHGDIYTGVRWVVGITVTMTTVNATNNSASRSCFQFTLLWQNNGKHSGLIHSTYHEGIHAEILHGKTPPMSGLQALLCYCCLHLFLLVIKSTA